LYGRYIALVARWTIRQAVGERVIDSYAEEIQRSI